MGNLALMKAGDYFALLLVTGVVCLQASIERRDGECSDTRLIQFAAHILHATRSKLMLADAWCAMCWYTVYLCQFMRREGQAGAWGTRVIFCLNSARQFGCVRAL